MRAMESFAGLIAKMLRRPLLIEAALLAPALGLLGLGGFEWGGYFWLQHRVQMAADQALAVALANPDPTQREPLALATAEQLLSGEVWDLSLEPGPSLRLAYDASASPVFAAAGIVPLPPSVIVRIARPS